MQLTEYAAARVLSQNSTKLYHFASLSLVRQVTSSRAASPLPCSLDDDRFAWTCKSSSTDSAPWRRGSRTHCRQSRPTPQSHKVRSALGAGDGIISGIKRRRVVEYGPCPGCAKGIDRWKRDDEFRDAMRAKLRLTNEFLWLSVGRLDPVKDHSTLLRAFALLPSEARLVIVGDGQLKNRLSSLIQEPGLSGRVHLSEFQADVLPWMCAADGFVLCSRWEGLPMALLEAGACRLPAVITNIPGAREVLPDSQRGQAVPPGDAHWLAASMEGVMRLPDMERRDLGEGIHKSVCERFSLDAVLTQWEKLYQLQLENNPLPSRVQSSPSSLGRTFQLQ